MSSDGSKSPPEETLLRLIRGKTAPPSVGVAGPMRGGIVLPQAVRAQSMMVDLPSWWMRATQLALGAVMIGELIVLAVLWFRPATTVAKLATPAAAAAPAAAPSQEELTAPSPSVSAVVSHPLFVAQPGARSPVGAPRPGSGMPSDDAKGLAARLSLIGIMGGASPQVIIEDTQTKKTFSVTVGQSLIEGLVVAEVLDNRVVLDLNGERIELSL